MAVCLEEARKRGDLPADSDTRRMASLLVDCWEGAALRSRLRRNPAPLNGDARLLLPLRGHPPGWPRDECGGARQRGQRHAGPSSGQERGGAGAVRPGPLPQLISALARGGAEATVELVRRGAGRDHDPASRLAFCLA